MYRNEAIAEQTPESILIKKDQLNHLSPLATGILTCCLHPTIDIEEAAQKMSHGKVTLGIISEYLNKECGWSFSEIREGIKELRHFIRHDL